MVSPPAPLTADGSFAYTERFDQPFSDGVVGHYTSTFAGRFGARTVAGTWRVHLEIAKGDGTPVGSCGSGVIRWAAAL
jgi:hypothetical protein